MERRRSVFLAGRYRRAVLKSDSEKHQQSHTIEFHLGEKLKGGRVDREPGGTIRYYNKTITLDSSGNRVEFSEDSRWANDNTLKNAWIEYDLGSAVIIDNIQLRLFKGESRTYPVVIEVDGKEDVQGEHQ